jgi:hypothetical protein
VAEAVGAAEARSAHAQTLLVDPAADNWSQMEARAAAPPATHVRYAWQSRYPQFALAPSGFSFEKAFTYRERIEPDSRFRNAITQASLVRSETESTPQYLANGRSPMLRAN